MSTPYELMMAGEYLNAVWVLYTTLLPGPFAYLPVLVFLGITFVLLWLKTRTIVYPVILLWFFMATYSTQVPIPYGYMMMFFASLFALVVLILKVFV